jgi:glycosyltransferase involved in cell wall biosynthesis
VLKEKGDKTVVNFYGLYSSSEKEAVDARGGELGVGDCISWGGRLSEEEFDRRMQKSMFTFAVYSSPVSGSSVLTRAMGNGTPVIASNIGGVPEYSQSLVLVPPDEPEALADAISKLKRDSALRKRLGYIARADAVKISWDVVAENTVKVYLDALRQ